MYESDSNEHAGPLAALARLVLAATLVLVFAGELHAQTLATAQTRAPMPETTTPGAVPAGMAAADALTPSERAWARIARHASGR